MVNNSIQKALQSLVKDLTERQKEVLFGRFGLDKSGETQTLEALGQRFGVTRERVRQIEASALDSLRGRLASDPLWSGLLDESKKYLKSVGGVAVKDTLLQELRREFPDLTENHLALALAATKEFYSMNGDKDFYPFYYLDKESLKNAQNFIQQWVGSLSSKKEQVITAGYDTHLKGFIKNKKMNPAHAGNFLSISKKIHQNPYGEVGLAEWAEIKPRTIRDRIYLVLKKETKPLHFQTIAERINQVGFDSKPALASTVHNELIKDERFVLVGRGMYGLSEHGYERGTAREVIQKILKKNGPMRSKEIVSALQKERFFKYNTILVNLQNRSFFERRPDGTYQVREA
jgi:predicted transcriptional regulator